MVGLEQRERVRKGISFSLRPLNLLIVVGREVEIPTTNKTGTKGTTKRHGKN